MKVDTRPRMIWDKEHETMSRPALQELQLERLKEKVRYCYERVPFYRQALESRGLGPDCIKSLDDLPRLPFTHKYDFRDNYPFGLLAVPLRDIVRVHASSGTTGKPTVVAYTKNDLDIWSQLMARLMTSCGVTKDDVVHNALGYGLFTGGLGYHYGAETVGAAVVPVSSGNTKRQIMLIQDFGATALASTPSYALYIAEAATEMGIDPHSLPLRVGLFGAEPWSYRMRDEIEDKLNILAVDTYGLSEVMGPGVSVECPERNGLHIYEDHLLAEIVDPLSGETVPYGEKGELVITTLTKEGLPVLRYRTRDITSLDPEPCACGRTLVRMSKVTGRTDDMLIIRGVNVFPTQIESVLLEVEGVEPHYQIIVERKGSLDDMEIWVEVTQEIFSDEMRKLAALEKTLRSELDSTLGLTARVKLVEPGTIERSEGKAKRIIDRRDFTS